MSKKKLFIQTLGCQMNIRDSEHMIAELSDKKDYELIDDMSSADLILINTCSVRDKPVRRLFSEIGNFNKKKKQGAKIGVCGCTASHLGKTIIQKAPYVDFVLGARNISKITDAIETHHFVAVDIDYDESTYHFSDFRGSKVRSCINISIGCDKKCTFCIVPHTRGQEISIPQNLILDEVRREVGKGVKEIFLLGQNVNNYGKTFSDNSEKGNFVELLRNISDINGVERIRFTSPHPLHMNDEFIEEFATNDKICKSIHIPLQSGSSEILKKMKRGYSKEWFLDRVEKIRSLVPSVSISTDIIVGFPDESDDDFADTIDVVEKCHFEQVFNFKYSPRDFTKAKDFDYQVADDIATRRLNTLIDLHKNHLVQSWDAQIGERLDVLIEEIRDGFAIGKSNNSFNVKTLKNNVKIGDIVSIDIISRDKAMLVGNIV
jgi:tRNA-2-methylthio-N6-dimethylallyladenosine synthase